jgi:hypothetical protein
MAGVVREIYAAFEIGQPSQGYSEAKKSPPRCLRAASGGKSAFVQGARVLAANEGELHLTKSDAF